MNLGEGEGGRGWRGGWRGGGVRGERRGERGGGGVGENIGGNAVASREEQTVFQTVRIPTAQHSPDNNLRAITILSPPQPTQTRPGPDITHPPPEHRYMYIQTHSGRRFVSLHCVRLTTNTGSVRFTAAAHDGRLPPRACCP